MNSNADADNDTPKMNQRGRKTVESKLIKSACKLMAEFGPRAVTIRDIAADAGVNHGQIHHYFGGKDGLLTAAIRHLAHEHAEHAKRRVQRERVGDSIDGSIPPPLTLARDKLYQMSVIRSVLDGRLDLATLEIEDGVSIPRYLLAKITESLGYDEPTIELKSALASAMAMEHAWAALDEYILVMVDAKPNEREAIRQAMADASRAMLKKLPPKET